MIFLTLFDIDIRLNVNSPLDLGLCESNSLIVLLAVAIVLRPFFVKNFLISFLHLSVAFFPSVIFNRFGVFFALVLIFIGFRWGEHLDHPLCSVFELLGGKRFPLFKVLSQKTT